MNLYDPVALFFQELIQYEYHNADSTPIRSVDLAHALVVLGCDAFEVLRPYSSLADGSSLDLTTLTSLISKISPFEDWIGLDPQSIHRMIPHWTASKYRTAPIQEVLEDIREKVSLKKIGFYAYNSNLNIRNRKSPNDPYLLLVEDSYCFFLDLNRKRSYRFSY